jgi:hypothetical protein
MDMATMRIRVRRDLVDEGSPSRFSDDELDRAINRAVTEFSRYLPHQQKSTISTVSNSDELDISGLSNLISVERVEFPAGNIPRTYTRFETMSGTVRLLDAVGDGNNCYVYWNTVHTLDTEGSTVPVQYEDLIALGATAYAVMSIAQAKTDTNNPGGTEVDGDYQRWAVNRLGKFEKELKRLNSKVRTGQLYPAD